MILQLSEELLAQIHEHGERAYPEEGAGFLLGASAENGSREVTSIFPLTNSREDEARHNRYLITPEDYLRGEQYLTRRSSFPRATLRKQYTSRIDP